MLEIWIRFFILIPGARTQNSNIFNQLSEKLGKNSNKETLYSQFLGIETGVGGGEKHSSFSFYALLYFFFKEQF